MDVATMFAPEGHPFSKVCAQLFIRVTLGEGVEPPQPSEGYPFGAAIFTQYVHHAGGVVLVHLAAPGGDVDFSAHGHILRFPDAAGDPARLLRPAWTPKLTATQWLWVHS